jgi:hypothetical protein
MGERHTVGEGECIASIAFARGFHPDTLWSDPGNEELRGRREHGYALLPGDVVAIPDKRAGESPCATDKVHTFRRRGVPEKLKIKLVEDGEPRADLSYVLVIDGRETRGKTTADGDLESWVSPSAQRATLRLAGEPAMELDLGFLHPINTTAGVRFRLRNLGFLRGDAGDDASLRDALLAFQTQHALEETGEASDATLKKLVDAHQS